MSYTLLDDEAVCSIGVEGQAGGWIPAQMGTIILDGTTNETFFLFFEKGEFWAARDVKRKLARVGWTTTPTSWVERFDPDTAPGRLVVLIDQERILESVEAKAKVSSPRRYPV